MTAYATALTRLERMTAADVDPLLSDAELADLLTLARRADAAAVAPDAYLPWAGTEAVALGVARVPTTRNGHYYTVTTAGTTGASEPTWPTTSGATVADGTAVWTESGPAPWTATYDLNAAAAEGWRWKGAKVTNRVTVAEDQQQLSRSDYLKHCAAMVRLYQAKIAQAVAVPGRGVDWTHEDEVLAN